MSPRVSALLLGLSGVDEDQLARVPQDRPKYIGMGGAVLTTAAMATLASSLALHMSLRTNVVLALLFGLVWGLAILNLDRWLIATTHQSKKQTLLLALPRVVLAVVIGAVMSAPLVLTIFAPEINAEL